MSDILIAAAAVVLGSLAVLAAVSSVVVFVMVVAVKRAESSAAPLKKGHSKNHKGPEAALLDPTFYSKATPTRSAFLQTT
jgi:hypothetical protein